MAQTLTYDLRERLVTIADRLSIRVFSENVRAFSTLWPVEQQAEQGSSMAGNTANVNQSALHENHPLASLFGKYSDEPLWDGFEEAIRRIREEDNATLE